MRLHTGAANGSTMKRFLRIFLAAFLAGVSASTVTDAQTGLNPAEKWVVAEVTAGEIADLRMQFPDEEKRNLSARFLEDLLTGALSGVKPDRHGVRISNATIDEPIDLKNAQISCEIWLHHCQFMSGVTFGRASFTGAVSFRDSTFKARADFNGMKVGGSAFFQRAVFEGQVDFAGADFASQFAAEGAQFKNKEQTASFNGMKVTGPAFFEKAVFEGPVDFAGADVASQFAADEAQFKNKEQTAGFNAMKVGQAALFNKAVFEGPVDFIGAEVASNFEADEAKFQNREQTASFNGIKVGGSAFFQKAVFEGPVEFTRADIASTLHAEDAQFKNTEKAAKFNGTKVRADASFTKTVFEGPADLSFSDFAVLNLSGSVYHGTLHLQAMTYKQIIAAPNEPESHEALLKLAGQSAYSADVYGNLEEFFKRQGYTADADRAFIEGKRRERKEYLHGFGRLGSLLLDWLVGYGRRPWQAGVPCVFFVALGCSLFSPARMEPQKPEDAPRVYNRFWYSLGLFLPFVDLQADKVWKPKPDQTFLRNYMRVHVLLGWILVPLVLAALTGLIK
jgi:uncharacterized protein YjbI with pentapeptide repeats